MSGPIPNMVEFEVAEHHARRAREERAYSKDSRARQLFYHARAAEEAARWHESEVRGVAALAVVTGTTAAAA